ncbi:hypothetical protein M407DRAFT_123432 [Tulasnella calospora MUT 4182]|uniref:Uncharacterized protein n=1 Tax=Tulasnella calospora MUT 4182 TaxID=1051891 RepID=A0A0C3LKK0_9AGAM|nr:hypothetical protein M407DRAFT_123432 [Tulasnella calospora MUT 4182]
MQRHSFFIDHHHYDPWTFSPFPSHSPTQLVPEIVNLPDHSLLLTTTAIPREPLSSQPNLHLLGGERAADLAVSSV